MVDENRNFSVATLFQGTRSRLAGRMEVSALKYSGGIGLHGRSPLLRLQSDERLVALTRRGNQAAFEVLISRYETRLLAFCRHMLGSREDAEDVLQEALAAAYNAILADSRPINVRPWLYRIARNRSLNHMRRAQAIGVDSMDIHLSDFGASTADKVSDRETFRMLVSDINELPETQRTALVLREMDALSYEQIAEAMETTVPSVKSLLVRARVSLAEAAEARLLTCEEVRIELGELAEGLSKKMSPPVRRHLKTCSRCSTFQSQLKKTNKALAAMLPIGPLVVLRKLLIAHLGHSAGSAAAGESRRRRGRARASPRRRPARVRPARVPARWARPARERPQPAPPAVARSARDRAWSPRAWARSRPRPRPVWQPPRLSRPAPSRSATPPTGPRAPPPSRPTTFRRRHRSPPASAGRLRRSPRPPPWSRRRPPAPGRPQARLDPKAQGAGQEAGGGQDDPRRHDPDGHNATPPPPTPAAPLPRPAGPLRRRRP